MKYTSQLCMAVHVHIIRFNGTPLIKLMDIFWLNLYNCQHSFAIFFEGMKCVFFVQTNLF